MDTIIAHRLADDLGAGVSHLDQDHADLLSLAHQFSKLRKGGDPRQAWSVLVELLCSAEAHWEREEDMLRGHGYPDAEGHARLHCQVRDGLSAMLACRSGNDNDSTEAEAIVVQMVIDDHRWKWWFLDSGIRPGAKG